MIRKVGFMRSVNSAISIRSIAETKADPKVCEDALEADEAETAWTIENLGKLAIAVIDDELLVDERDPRQKRDSELGR